MKKSEVADLLTAIASTDNRTVGRLDIEMWFKILPEDLTLANAQDALIRLRLETGDWITPKHIVDRVTEVRRDRLQRAGTPPIPPDLTWTQEKAWRQLWCEAVKDGEEDPEAYANEAMGITPLAIEATSESIAELRRQLVAGLAESKAVPKPLPEDNRPKKPRTRWGCWWRGSWQQNDDGDDIAVFSADGNRLFHEGGPYGVEIAQFTRDPQFWIDHIGGKGWGTKEVLRLLVLAWADITGVSDVEHWLQAVDAVTGEGAA